MIFNPDALHLYRRRLRLTLKGLASRAGMTLDMVWRIENGLKLPTREQLSTLAAALDVSEHSLMQAVEQGERVAAATSLDAVRPLTRAGYVPADRPSAPAAESIRLPVGSVVPAWIEQTPEGPKLLRILSVKDILNLTEDPVETGLSGDEYSQEENIYQRPRTGY